MDLTHAHPLPVIGVADVRIEQDVMDGRACNLHVAHVYGDLLVSHRGIDHRCTPHFVFNRVLRCLLLRSFRSFMLRRFRSFLLSSFRMRGFS